jgi:hypothetical protein
MNREERRQRRRPEKRGRTMHRMSCHRKRRFRSEGDARRMIATVKRRAEYDGGELVPYECTVCRGWHVGHKLERDEY